MPDQVINQPDLKEKVQKWISGEGYPLEFRSANTFKRHNFEVYQGRYVEDEAEKQMREVDVQASMTQDIRDNFFARVTYIVECKWSGDKPWVVFTSPDTQLSGTACIAQTIGSRFGTSVLRSNAGRQDLHQWKIFNTPTEGGFGGRQAFSKGNDYFFNALKSVVSNSFSYANSYDKRYLFPGQAPEACIVVLPLIVVEGTLFRAYFNEIEDELAIEERGFIRCHWNGSPTAVAYSTVDIVTINYLETYINERAREVERLLDRVCEVAEIILQCFDAKSLEPFNRSPLRPLLRDFFPIMYDIKSLEQT